MGIVTGTDFIYLPTRDFERAVEFYGTTLGLHCSARYGKRPGAEFETGNLTLLIAVEEFGMTFHVNENAIALHVETSRRPGPTWSHAASSSWPTRWTRASATSFFRDPDGNALMLHHRYAPKHQD